MNTPDTIPEESKHNPGLSTPEYFHCTFGIEQKNRVIPAKILHNKITRPARQMVLARMGPAASRPSPPPSARSRQRFLQ